MNATDYDEMIMIPRDTTRCVGGFRIARSLILLVVLGLGLFSLFV